MMVFLVRHAQAIPRGDWDSADLDRPLSRKGLRQAPAIAESLKARIDGDTVKLVSSPAMRCVQTIQPLADTLGLDVETDGRLVEIDHVEESLRPPPGQRLDWLGARAIDVLSEQVTAMGAKGNVVVCTHGEVLPPTLERLCPDDAALFSGTRNEKGGFWMLRLKNGRCSNSEYVPAP